MSTPHFEVREITAAETVELRWPILRAGLARETAIFEGDDWPETRHFGAFSEGRLMGVATILRAPFPADARSREARQVRGMAVRSEAQGKGCGAALLAACAEAARAAGAEVLWCNARTPAAGFYRRHGFEAVGEEFEIPTAGPHFRMWHGLR
jgi:GNAT superfamily N-acetyltransferase